MTLFETWDEYDSYKLRKELVEALLSAYRQHGAGVVLEAIEEASEFMRLEESYDGWERYGEYYNGEYC